MKQEKSAGDWLLQSVKQNLRGYDRFNGEWDGFWFEGRYIEIHICSVGRRSLIHARCKVPDGLVKLLLPSGCFLYPSSAFKSSDDSFVMLHYSGERMRWHMDVLSEAFVEVERFEFDALMLIVKGGEDVIWENKVVVSEDTTEFYFESMALRIDDLAEFGDYYSEKMEHANEVLWDFDLRQKDEAERREARSSQ